MIILDTIDKNEVLGAGGFGLVLQTSDNKSIKLFKNIDECQSLKNEAEIHRKIYKIFDNKTFVNVKIPFIYEYFNETIVFDKTFYLCGILMDKIEPLYDNLQFHIAFGCELDDDINTIHYSDNHPRGFYGSVDFLVNLIESKNEMVKEFPQEAFTDPENFIESLVIKMAKVYKRLFDSKIVPYDIEFVIDKYGDLWCLDFGLCYEVKNIKQKDYDKILNNNEYIPCYGYLRNIFIENF